MKYILAPEVEGITSCELVFSDLLGKGGNADVYKEQIGANSYAVKRYRTKAKVDVDKLEFMIRNHPGNIFQELGGVRYPRFSWPLALIREESDSKVIGFVMPLVDEKRSRTLDYFYDFTLSKRLSWKSSAALSFKVDILKNLCLSIRELHENGTLLIDLKPQNIRVFEGTNVVTLLDCDSFKVIDGKSDRVFEADMVSSDYISPELLRAGVDKSAMSIAQDHYALAVMIFQMLNNGIHPFQGVLVDEEVSAATNDEKAALGFYPYGLNKHSKILPREQSIHDSLLGTTRALFDDAFCAGRVRPTAAGWTEHFDGILQSKLIVRCKDCPADVEHMHFRDKPCPKCASIAKIADRAADAAENRKPIITSFADISPLYPVPELAAQIQKPAPLGLWLSLILGVVALVITFLLNSTFINFHSVTASTAYDTTVGNSASQRSDANFTVSSPSSRQPLDASNTRDHISDEEQNYHDARGDIDRLKNYVQRCNYCSHRSDALSEIARLEEAKQMRETSVSTICQNALASNKTDWDRDASYQKYVIEARRRALDVDGCRAALGMQSLAEEELSRNPTVKFDITNNTAARIGIAFYDGNNRQRIFPGDDRYYTQSARRKQSYSISCSPGQSVCFGSWKGTGDLNPFWGVGYSGREYCAHCCTNCPTKGSVSYTLDDSDARRPNPTLTWVITDHTRHQLAIAFYSASRPGHEWPGLNRHWNMNGGENTYTLSCVAGEKICYGAWDNANPYGPNWGVGLGGRAGCSNCCASCNGGVHRDTFVD